MPSAKYIARGRLRFGLTMSPPAKLITANPRKAKKVIATLEMIERHDGYPLGASRCGWSFVIVATMKTENTTSSPITITDCALSTQLTPTITSPTDARTTSDAQTFV